MAKSIRGRRAAAEPPILPPLRVSYTAASGGMPATPLSEPVPGGDHSVQPTPAPSAPPAGATRMTIPVADDGRVLVDQLRDSTKTRLATVFLHPGNQQAFVGPSLTPAEAFPDPLIGMLYDALGLLLMGLARAAGYAHDEASTLLFTDKEKSALVPATQPVLAKHLGGTQYQAEAVLASVFVAILAAKVVALKATATVIAFPQSVPPDLVSSSPDSIS